ncbi:AAEL006603-PA [Aedes aegypti]|uniref:AAEL006603-PA n=1 Tax=Aedes aegypti TaxID=7159 RepID=Q175N2_AEDAE|nr:AAEL006603-PA [Aedes aegypti]
MTEIKKEISSETICRLCLQERDHYRSIFPSDSIALDDWIESLTTIKILYVPNSPAALCLECETILKNYESFREMCFINDRSFREMFPQTTESIDDYEDRKEGHEVYTFEYMVKEERDLQSDTIPEIENIAANENNSSEFEAVHDWTESSATSTDHFPYQCHICLRRFRVERNLKRHGRVHMPKMAKVQCEHCEKMLTNYTALRIHMRSHTREEEPYGCQECGQSFSTSGLLTRHVRIHNKNRMIDSVDAQLIK